MQKISRAILLPLKAKAYQEHMSYHASIAKSNTGQKKRDPRCDITQIVEENVRGEISKHLNESEYRVIKWEEKNIYGSLIPRFKELDAVYELGVRNFAILEVKASTALSRLKKGIKQLRKSVLVLSTIDQMATGILAVSNLGKFTNAFGQLKPDIDLAELEYEYDVTVIKWPVNINDLAEGGIFLIFVPDEVTETFIKQSSLAQSVLLQLDSET